MEDELMPVENVTGEDQGLYNESEFDRMWLEHPEEMRNPTKINPFFYPIVVTYSITFFIGLIGNIVAIMVIFGERKNRNATNLFLVSLAIADVLLLLVCVPLETLQYFVFEWDKDGTVCKMAQYVELLSATASITNLCALTLERFVVIVLPMRSRSLCTISNCRRAICVVWIVAILLSIPVIFTKDTYKMTYYNSETSITLYYCYGVTGELEIAIYQLVILLVIPGLLILVCYTKVIRELWKSTKNINMLTNPGSTTARRRDTSRGRSWKRGRRAHRDDDPFTSFTATHGNGQNNGSASSVRGLRISQSRSKGDEAKRARKQVIKMLILVVVLFILCWGPKLIMSVCLKVMNVTYSPENYVIRVIVNLIPYVHSCINPFIYSFMSKNFRRAMNRQILGCSRCARKRENGEASRASAIPMHSTMRVRTALGVNSLYTGPNFGALRTEVEVLSSAI